MQAVSSVYYFFLIFCNCFHTSLKLANPLQIIFAVLMTGQNRFYRLHCSVIQYTRNFVKFSLISTFN